MKHGTRNCFGQRGHYNGQHLGPYLLTCQTVGCNYVNHLDGEGWVDENTIPQKKLSQFFQL